jgi:hypothetical protein
MKRISVCCLAWSILLACAGSDEPTPGTYGAICNGTKPCKSDLVCTAAAGLDGVCTKMCTIMPNSTECSSQFGAGSVCDQSSRCYDMCTPGGNECPPGLNCTFATVNMGTCRPPR